MKKIVIFAVACLLSLNAYPFWGHAAKDKKAQDSKHRSKVNPALQFSEAMKFFEKGDFKKTIKTLRFFIKKYPDAEELADAHFYLGRCFEEVKNYHEAFLSYQKVIDSYPNSKRINEALDREYKIADSFLREPKKFMGLTKYDFLDHPSIEIFKKIVEKSPYTVYGPVSQYKLGVLFSQLNRYDEAREAFQKVVDTFPESEWAAPAKYQLAIVTAKSFAGTDYDSTSLEDAARRLEEFIKQHPEADVVPNAREQLSQMQEKEAQKNFGVAQFYEKQKNYKSAVAYYQLVAENYPHTSCGVKAGDKIKELKGKR